MRPFPLVTHLKGEFGHDRVGRHRSRRDERREPAALHHSQSVTEAVSAAAAAAAAASNSSKNIFLISFQVVFRHSLFRSPTLVRECTSFFPPPSFF